MITIRLDRRQAVENPLQFLDRELRRIPAGASINLDLAFANIKKDLAPILNRISGERVRVLNLSGNSLEDRDVELIAGALKAQSSIQKIILSSNRIGDDGAVELAGVMLNRANLEIDLRKN